MLPLTAENVLLYCSRICDNPEERKLLMYAAGKLTRNVGVTSYSDQGRIVSVGDARISLKGELVLRVEVAFRYVMYRRKTNTTIYHGEVRYDMLDRLVRSSYRYRFDWDVLSKKFMPLHIQKDVCWYKYKKPRRKAV